MPRMVCGPKKNKQKSRNVPKKRRDVPKNTLNWKMTSWPIPWELKAQTWSKRKVLTPKMVCGPKKIKKLERPKKT